MRVSIEEQQREVISSLRMGVGQVGEAATGRLLLRTPTGFVDLYDPEDDLTAQYDTEVTILPPGTKVILTIEE